MKRTVVNSIIIAVTGFAISGLGATNISRDEQVSSSRHSDNLTVDTDTGEMKSFEEYCNDENADREIQKTVRTLMNQVDAKSCKQAKELLSVKKQLRLSGFGIKRLEPLASFKNLEELALNGNKISDLYPLKELTNLKALWLANNSIENISSLSYLTKLTKLSLSRNSVSNISPIKQIKGLKHLSLNNNNIQMASRIDISLASVQLRGNPKGDLCLTLNNTVSCKDDGGTN